MDCSICGRRVMRNLVIKGGNRLHGSIDIHGAKNSVLPIISATVLLNGVSVLHNCPDLSDVSAALGIIDFLGITYKKSGSDIVINSTCPYCHRIPDELMRSMRSSVMFLGAIIARCKSAEITLPGGCNLGPRPIDIHISALSRLGVKVKKRKDTLEFTAENGLIGADVYLRFPSVGATENVIMAAVLAKGTTRIYGAAKEPEIKDLADFLNKAGADISGAGTDSITINGVAGLGGAEHTVIPDRIEAATYMAAAAATGGSIAINKVVPEHLTAISRAFEKCGCEITNRGDRIFFSAPERLVSPGRTVTGVYPAFPTDAGPLLISALTSAYGTSVFYERIFKNRYGFIDEISKLGAVISVSGAEATVKGVNRLIGADVSCTDLRGGAALVIAALRAQGRTTVGNLCHIRRGYQDIANNLRRLGADISEE